MAHKERWASRLGLVLAMAGNAVGLGNFLRFPAQAAKNGGGAFLIPYLVALIVIGLPLIWVEWTMGRFAGRHGHHSSPGAFDAMGKGRIWKYFGVFGLWTNLIIAAYYLYIESWTISYSVFSAFGGFGRVDAGSFFANMTGERPGQLFAFSSWGIAVFALCLLLNVFILSRGLARGIELVCKVGMPLLIVFGMLLAVRGLLITPDQPGVAPGFWTDVEARASPLEGLNFVWNPRFEAISNPAVWLAAAGQIFFTLSIGMGSIHCYASYLRETDDVALTGATAAWTNEFCEVIIGGSILLPIAVAYLGLETVQAKTAGGSGFELGFLVFPTLFQKWGFLAPYAGFMWFGLLFFAAITSSLAMGQPIMAFLQTEFKFSRAGSAWTFGLMLLPLAIPVAVLRQSTFFDEFDYWAGTFALVVFALLEAILFGWVFGIERGWEELKKGAELKIPKIFYFIIKYVTPVFLGLILLGSFFQPEGGWDGYYRQSQEAKQAGQPAPAWRFSPDSIIGKLTHADLTKARADLEAKIEAMEKRNGAADQAEKSKTGSGVHLTNVKPDENAMTGVELKASRDKELEALRADLALNGQLPFWRNLDRIAMVVAFAFFSLLVRIAWKRRAAAGAIA
jgi:NSS family neurotransmitter:Na+ symporter